MQLPLLLVCVVPPDDYVASVVSNQALAQALRKSTPKLLLSCLDRTLCRRQTHRAGCTTEGHVVSWAFVNAGAEHVLLSERATRLYGSNATPPSAGTLLARTRRRATRRARSSRP